MTRIAILSLTMLLAALAYAAPSNAPTAGGGATCYNQFIRWDHSNGDVTVLATAPLAKNLGGVLTTNHTQLNSSVSMASCVTEDAGDGHQFQWKCATQTMLVRAGMGIKIQRIDSHSWLGIGTNSDGAAMDINDLISGTAVHNENESTAKKEWFVVDRYVTFTEDEHYALLLGVVTSGGSVTFTSILSGWFEIIRRNCGAYGA
jgi:hypothetical protein